MPARIKIGDRVEHLLASHSALRDDDKKLWIAYLVIYHGLKEKLGDDAYDAFCDLYMEEAPSSESVRRVRQKIQEEGKYLGEKRIKRLRTRNPRRKIIRDK